MLVLVKYKIQACVGIAKIGHNFAVDSDCYGTQWQALLQKHADMFACTLANKFVDDMHSKSVACHVDFMKANHSQLDTVISHDAHVQHMWQGRALHSS